MKKTGIFLLLLTLLITLAACSPVIRYTLEPTLPARVVPTRAGPTEVEPYTPGPVIVVPTLLYPTIMPYPSATTYVKPELPALYGLWMKDHDQQRDLLTITQGSVYLVEADNGSVHESFYELQSVDWVNGVLALQLRWVRINGNYGGFDSPSKVMKVSIADGSLFFSTVDAGMDLPSTADNGPWSRK
jgi:hypothetical protein